MSFAGDPPRAVEPLDLGCPACAVSAGARCVSSSGQPAKPHAARRQLAAGVNGLLTLAVVTWVVRHPDLFVLAIESNRRGFAESC